MKTKKVIAFVCALSMMTVAVPQNTSCDFNICGEQKVFAYADNFGNVDESGLEYIERGNETIAIIGYSGEATVLVIPDEINGRRVTEIEFQAFYECSDLTEITIPEGVTEIGAYAFSGCSSLTEIKIPKGVTSIGHYAFSGTPWLKNKRSENPAVVVNGILVDGKKCKGNVVIPDGVTSIGIWAFENCIDLTGITIPEGVTSIEDNAFEGCSGLTKIKFPEGLKRIENGAFCGCSGLTEIIIPEGVTSIGAFAFFGTQWLKNKQADDPMVVVNGILIDGTKCKGSVVVPEGVTSILNWVFFECSDLTEITIPEGVTSIGDCAFEGCDSPFIIRGAEGSYAQEYAINNNIKFEILNTPNATVKGDINNDGIVSTVDFIKLVQYILDSEKQINSRTSDINGDGIIDLSDAVELKKFFLG